MFPIKIRAGEAGERMWGEDAEKLLSKVVFKGKFLSSALDF